MKKQLNVDVIQSELRGGSAFFPGYKGTDSPPLQADTPKKEAVPSPQSKPVSPGESAPSPVAAPVHQPEPLQAVPERVNARSPVRPTGKRIITRNSFEIYEDQMDSLRKRSLQEKMEGKLGSMSQMVREAIDAYLKNSTSTD